MRKLTAIVAILAGLALGASAASARGGHNGGAGLGSGHGGSAKVATFSGGAARVATFSGGGSARIAAPRFASQSRVASSAAFQGNGRAHHRHHRHHPVFIGAGYPYYDNYYDNYDDDDIVCYYSRKYERRICRPA